MQQNYEAASDEKTITFIQICSVVQYFYTYYMYIFAKAKATSSHGKQVDLSKKKKTLMK